MENKEVFSYTYSAQQKEEVQKIRDKYLPKTEDKMEVLRRLDKSVTQKGRNAALTLGILGSLVLGSGMSCCMVGTPQMFIPGIFIGVVGIVMVSLAYPLYKHITKKAREKAAPEILRLTDELMR